MQYREDRNNRPLFFFGMTKAFWVRKPAAFYDFTHSFSKDSLTLHGKDLRGLAYGK